MQGQYPPNRPLSKQEQEDKELTKQFARWEEFLNISIGLVSLNLALACLGTHRPSTYAAFCFVSVMAIRIGGARYFPEKLREARKKAKSNMKFKDKGKEIVGRFLSIRRLLTNYLPFLIGILMLVFIMLSHVAEIGHSEIVPFINEFVGP
jgi:hypothetical protein